MRDLNDGTDLDLGQRLGCLRVFLGDIVRGDEGCLLR